MRLGFYRHGPTEWNHEKRLQGRTDIALTDEAKAWLDGHTLPAGFQPAACFSSPLCRAMETARILSPVEVMADCLLIETNWGDWEGKTITALRQADPVGMAEMENRGLDLTPPGGESPRDVGQRLAVFCKSLADRAGEDDILAVTHKGVIRAAMALATGWDFMGKPPEKLNWQCLHIFEVGPGGRLSMAAPNVALEVRS